jgi:hypothetical protein
MPVYTCTTAHRVNEVKSGVAESQVFEEGVDRHTVERAPGAATVLPRLRLLPSVVVVQELVKYAHLLLWRGLIRLLELRRIPILLVPW